MAIEKFTLVNDRILQLDYMWACIGKDYRFMLNLPEQPFWGNCTEITLSNPTDKDAVVIVNCIMLKGCDRMFAALNVELRAHKEVTVPTSLTVSDGEHAFLDDGVTLVL